MNAEALFSQLEFNTGEFPEEILTEAVEQRDSIIPLLLEELRRAAADPKALSDLGGSYIRHIYAMYMLAQFRVSAAYPLLVDLVSTPGEVVMELMGDVVTEDLERMLASLCHGDLAPIKRLIEDPEVNEWVRGAALDALVVLYAEGQLEREQIIDYLKNLFSTKVERKSSYLWSTMINTACDLYPEELIEEIKRAYGEDLVDSFDVGFDDVKNTLAKGKESQLADTKSRCKGLIGNVIDEIGWWACFRESAEVDHLVRDPFEVEDDFWLPEVKQVVRQRPMIGRNDPCPCGSGKKYKKCCLGKDALRN